MKQIIPFLWFDDQAEEAASFYVSVFPNSELGSVARYDEEGAKVSGRPAGSAMTVSFKLNGQEFIALNGGPIFKFSEAISFVINCDTQEEIDSYWEKLSAVPEAEQCGWLKDKYGVSWQIIPTQLGQLLGDPDPEKAGRVMKAMLQMKKINLEELKKAQAGV
jgi:predicted 3-demethylubiquinone-9 3-methyltransferase (glyoxalase superfamily)